MQLKIAEIKDIENILKLHSKYQLATIAEDDKKDGFVTTGFSKEELTALIEQEQGLFIAVEDDKVLGYVMSASWQFWSKWPMFVHMIKDLPKLNYLGQTLTVNNSYQYGPVCIDKSVRGSGLLEKLFDFALESMSKRYPILVTFVNVINERSYAAHKRKLGLDVIQEFEFNNNRYYEMVFDTSKRVLVK
ncbi:GNAT family acetyltransferase [Arcobacter sp. KX21116]|uniref:GNAT family N-acetyltransferase n=1 Tax=Arcobacter iocasae TaxID=2906515 RepID=UPI0035D4191C